MQKKILELAKINSKQTVMIVSDHLHDEAYLDDLIMKRFNDFPQDQYNFLLAYMRSKEK